MFSPIDIVLYLNFNLWLGDLNFNLNRIWFLHTSYPYINRNIFLNFYRIIFPSCDFSRLAINPKILAMLLCLRQCHLLKGRWITNDLVYGK